MYALPAWALDALRGPHVQYGYVTAWRDGKPLPYRGESRLPLVEQGQNQIEVDGSTPGVRRKLTATVPAADELWELLAPVGTELQAYSVIEALGQSVTIPQGVFDIDVQSMSYRPDGNLQVTAPDRFVRVQRARFLRPRHSQFGDSAARQIARLVLEVLPAGTNVIYTNRRDATVPLQVWDRDRDKTVEELCKAASLDVFVDRGGNVVIRDAPTLGDPVWTVDASANGVLIDADRDRNRQKTFNVVVVNPTIVDEHPLFDPVFVWDDDPGSPTYAGVDPVNRPDLAGPFGVRPTFYASPLLRTRAQAEQAGRTILARVTGLAKQLTVTAASNPALDDGDTIRAELPTSRPGGAPDVEWHLADRFTLPLFPTRQAQRIDTRSTRADAVGDSEDTSG